MFSMSTRRMLATARSFTTANARSLPTPNTRSLVPLLTVAAVALTAGAYTQTGLPTPALDPTPNSTAAELTPHHDWSSTVGHTKLVYLKSLSEETGCNIYGKAEYQNPSGSVKDRTVMGIIQDAERNG